MCRCASEHFIIPTSTGLVSLIFSSSLEDRWRAAEEEKYSVVLVPKTTCSHYKSMREEGREYEQFETSKGQA